MKKALLTTLALLACGKTPKPIEDAAPPPVTIVADAEVAIIVDAAPPSYTNPVLHAQACPKRPPPDPNRYRFHEVPECKKCSTNEFCVTWSSRGRHGSNCVKDGCSKDADCAKGELCICALDQPNICVRANCRDSNDCGGRECAPSNTGAYCRTKDDTCQTNAECGKEFVCSYSVRNGHYECQALPPPPLPG